MYMSRSSFEYPDGSVAHPTATADGRAPLAGIHHSRSIPRRGCPSEGMPAAIFLRLPRPESLVRTSQKSKAPSTRFESTRVLLPLPLPLLLLQRAVTVL